MGAGVRQRQYLPPLLWVLINHPIDDDEPALRAANGPVISFYGRRQFKPRGGRVTVAAARAWRQAPLQRLLEGPHSGQQYSPARVTAGQVRLRLPAAGGGPTPGKPCCIAPLGSRFWNPTEEAMRWLRQKVMLMYCGVLAAGSAETRVCCALFTVMGLAITSSRCATLRVGLGAGYNVRVLNILAQL